MNKLILYIRKSIIPAVILIGTIIIVSCDDEFLKDSDEMPVIEGWIDSNGYPVVLFSKSISPSKEGMISDNVIRWGKVTISDGVDTIVMTGCSSKDYFPPYYYYTQQMVGEPGRTYTVTAEFKNLHAESTSLLLSPTPISNISLHSVEGNDTLVSAVLTFVAPVDCPAYYYVNIKDFGSKSRSYPAMCSSVCAERPGTDVEIPLFRPKLDIDTAHYVPHFVRGQHFIVELCRIEKPVYDFWRAYDNMTMFGGSQFIGSESGLPSNIIGGYGVWSARGVSRKELFVK